MDDRAEYAPFQSAVGEFGKVALDRVKPAGGRGCEVEDEARMPRQPGMDLRLLVSGVVVKDDVDNLAGWELRLDEIECGASIKVRSRRQSG